MFSGLAIGDGAEQISGDIFRDNPFSVEKKYRTATSFVVAA